ncbi:hypothetical protein RJ639_022887 [Escallonia herrerae]|uniref:Uncharacterized protein n=1 Tax=Escallonia herrerae TaxID=1293975 RepID=A0AA89ACM5_9ASTE|nr:hypothetical protein RJ639_022887 [Escallonia herrerae]
MLWIANATHKNPQYFPNPESIDTSKHQTWPGHEFARLAMLVFMHSVVTQFRWEELLADERVLASPIPTPALAAYNLLCPFKSQWI